MYISRNSDLDSRIASVKKMKALLAQLSEVIEPCAAAQGYTFGITDMGLVTEVELVERGNGAIYIIVTLRLTTPGCLYKDYFRNEIRRIAAQNGIECAVEFSQSYSWSEEAMSSAAKDILKTRRARLSERALKLKSI